MKLPKQKESEALKLYHQYFDSYINGDLETYASTLDKEVEMIGTTESEVAHNKTEIIELFKGHIDQMVGKADMRNRQISAKPLRDMVLINETCDIYVLGEPELPADRQEWTFYSKVRISTILHETDSGWKIIQQHGSLPDMRVQEGETIAIDKISRENIELRHAVKRRTVELENKNRELEIEAALERVRAKSMAMKTQSDLLGIIELFGEQLRAVDVRFGQVAFIEGPITKTRDWDLWSYVPQAENTNKVHIPYIDHPYFLKTAKAVEEYQKTGKAIQVKYFTKEEKNTFLPYYLEHAPAMSDEIVDYVYATPGSMIVDAFLEEVTVSMVKWDLEPYTAEELAIFERFAKEFRQTYIRFLDIKKAEEQARESEIQLSLERVRAKSMAMKTQSDLLGIIELFGEQLRAVDVRFDHVTFIEGPITKTRDWDLWTYIPQAENTNKVHIPYIDHPYFLKTAKAVEEYQKTGKAIQLKYFTKEEKNTFLPYYFEHAPALSDEILDYLYTTPGQMIVDAFLEEVTVSMLKWHPEPPTEEELEIFERFAKEFRQTYIRFLDIKKAEEQAREAQIEASLERVRAKAMSMQNSDELDEVLSVLCEQFDVLGILPMSTHMTVFNFENNTFTFRETGKYGDRSFGEQTVDLDAMDTWKDTVDKWKADKATDVNKLHFPPETLPQVWDVFHESFASMPEESRITPADYPDGIYHTAGKHPFGYIGMNQTRPATREEEEIVIKFANEFGRAYQRFLDLQKAEDQAREAQIEASLEKVRAQSMGMQTSDDLSNVASVMFDEMKHLGGELFAFGIVLCDKDKDTVEQWHNFGNQGMMSPITVPIELDYIHKYRYNRWLAGEELFSIEIPEDYIKKHFDLMFELPSVKAAMDEVANQGVEVEIPDWEIDYGASFKYGYLLVSSRKPFEESHIFPRFAKVFDQAYTRFQDLQKAEAQANEAMKQASLDRVRGEIASMRSTDDLENITPLIWNELNTLGVPFIRCGVFIIHEEEQEVEVYLSKPDGTSLAVMHLPFNSNELAVETVDAWRNKKVYTQHWSREEFLQWGRSMMEQNQVADMKTYQGAEEAPESLHLHFIPFNQGMLYVGSTVPLDDEDISLSESLAKAFSIAYARYEDFVKLEKAKAGIEDALTELKATQSQLVQQEKLASLGQLTAGIAHEIKNPLNFVNNFSEVSLELVEEMRDEVRRGTGDGRPGSEKGKVKSEKAENPLLRGDGIADGNARGVSGEAQDSDLILEILDDIEANLRKIHEHGSRADSIVKSMLQHSRGGDGKLEPTPLNPIVKEYVNLAFHGMRAGKEPINVDIDLQLGENVGELPLIAEDFSRVILNLCNNAFDAMRDKLTGDGRPETGNSNDHAPNSKRYSPKLTVRTKSGSGKVILEIEDNGPGIPDEMKDKILQPFFTTKKGTQGTGLGLSITNDIVKAHGGSMEIDSQPGQTTFTIKLTV